MSILKRFLVFYGDIYYPKQGFEDFHSSYLEPEEAILKLKELRKSEGKFEDTWGQVVDKESGEILWELSRKP